MKETKYLQHNLTGNTTCHYPKYQPVTDILNFLGIGVKVSFTILNIFGVTRATGL